MHQKLPREIDPYRLAKSGLLLEGELKVSDMKRLSKSLYDDQGLINVKMQFDIDESSNTYTMHGAFVTSLPLICERCMKPMHYDVNVNCALALVNSEKKVEGLAEQYDPWVIDNDEPILLNAVVEDELILALPLVPRHENDCLPADAWCSGEDIHEEVEKPASPFAVLESLKSKN